MRRFEREINDPVFINEMLKLFDTVHLGINDEDGFPYVVPVNFGYEIKDNKLYIYIHCAKQGKKVDLMKKNPRICATFSVFNDFPDCMYKKHRHDYRSIIAKGIIHFIDANDIEQFEHGYNLLYTCNNRDIVPLSNRKVIPPIYIGVIECNMKNVTAKSEFPIRNIEDVPMINVYNMPKDDEPFDISDIIETKKQSFK